MILFFVYTNKMTNTTITIVFIITSTVVLLIYKSINKNNDIERFFQETNSFKYHILKYSKLILYIAIFYNIKYLITSLMKT